MTEITKELEATIKAVDGLVNKLASIEATQKALEERVANVEEVLSKGVKGVAPLALEGSNPVERFENFLAGNWKDERLVKYQDLCDAYTIFATIRRHKGLPVDGWLHRRFVEITKAVTGSDLPNYIPTTFSSRVIQLIRLKPSLANVFDRIEMPSEIYKPPLSVSGITVSYVAAGTSIPTSSPSAQAFELRAKKLGAAVEIADEVTEDSIVAIMPTFQDALAFAFADALDKAILQGDTTSADALLKVWDGILKLAQELNITDSFQASHIQDATAQLGELGVDPNRVVVVVSPSVYANMVKWDEVSTVDKYGAQATILTGELGKIYGKPIVVSPHVPNDVHAVVVARPAFLLGERRGLRVETQRDVLKQVDILVATGRWDFAKLPYDVVAVKVK